MDRRTPTFESSNKPNPSNTLNSASKLKDFDQLFSNEMNEYQGDNNNLMQDVRRRLSYNHEENESSCQLFTFRQREEESENSIENEPNAEILNEILILNEKIIQPSFDKSLIYKQHRDLLNKLKKFNFSERNLESELLKFVQYANKSLTPEQQERMSEYYHLMNGPLLNITKYDELEEVKLLKTKEELLKKVYDLEDELETLKKHKKMRNFENELKLAEEMNKEYNQFVKEKIDMENNNIFLMESNRQNERNILILENEIKLKKELIAKINNLLTTNKINHEKLMDKKSNIKTLNEEIQNFVKINNQATKIIQSTQEKNKILESTIQEKEKLKDEKAEIAEKKEKESRNLQGQAEKKENENKLALEIKKANLKKIEDLDHEIQIISSYNIELASKKRQMELKEFERKNQEMKRINDDHAFSQHRNDCNDEGRAKFLDIELFKKKNLEFEKSKNLKNQLDNLEETKLGLLKEIKAVSLQPILQNTLNRKFKTEELFCWFLVAFLMLAILLKHVFLIYF